MDFNFVKTELGSDPIVVEGYFASPPERVFEAWTDPKIVMKWFGRAPNTLISADIDLIPGGTWQFIYLRDEEKSVGFEGHYLEIENGVRLVFSWSHVVTSALGVREASPASQVEVLFTKKGGGTDIKLIHSAILDADTRQGTGGGWEVAFTSMQALLNKT